MSAVTLELGSHPHSEALVMNGRSVRTGILAIGRGRIGPASYSDLPLDVDVDGVAGVEALSVFAAGLSADPLSAPALEAAAPSEPLPPSCDLPEAAGLAA